MNADQIQKPEQARMRLLEIIENKRRLHISEVFDFARKRRLYFGPGVGPLDALFDLEARGLIRINESNGQVELMSDDRESVHSATA